MMLFDTHCHIADEAFDADREAVIDRFRAAGVLRALVVAESFTAKAVVNSIMAASRPLKMRFVNFKILSPF